jgi:hypothetical protein
MRAGIVVNVTRADRHRLEAIVSDRSAPQKHGKRRLEAIEISVFEATEDVAFFG